MPENKNNEKHKKTLVNIDKYLEKLEYSNLQSDIISNSDIFVLGTEILLQSDIYKYKKTNQRNYYFGCKNFKVLCETLRKCDQFSNSYVYIELNRVYHIINELINLKLFDKYGNYINYNKINIESNGIEIFEINNNKINSIRKIFIDIIGKYPGNDIFTNIIEKYIFLDNILNLPIGNGILAYSNIRLKIYVEKEPFYYYTLVDNTYLFDDAIYKTGKVLLEKDDESFFSYDNILWKTNNIHDGAILPINMDNTVK